MSGHLLSFGHGYSARALAQRLRPRGWHITATTRSADKAADLAADGIAAVVIDAAAPTPEGRGALEAALARASHLLVSAGPDAGGDPLLQVSRDAVARAAPHLDWAGYLSTTGVYGDHGGGWVDEATPLAPTTRRGEMRVAAEADWQRLAQDSGLPLHIFRLAGIYGPGRGPFAKVRAGTARRIVKPGQVFSRIHVEDIAQVLDASIARPDPGAVYNLCDDDPAPPQDVIAHAARLLGLPVPPEVPFDEAEMSAMARSFYAESKRVRNDRIKHDLGVRLAYPTYREGLAALRDDEE
ncbi:SDR family oxidoreductase [Mesobaculum littorinae]|uniref:SDR family oxidoreductase n=1 Tax=Mesobaculum littorinae TaxID=2486419 RepID=A0A438AFA1_9RHOB|nr:SDR family oxidoreductase [Mesobaculum littorinae]RVV97368.1 SDR family oxidoreductase [Mesobaculum littorinae]